MTFEQAAYVYACEVERISGRGCGDWYPIEENSLTNEHGHWLLVHATGIELAIVENKKSIRCL